MGGEGAAIKLDGVDGLILTGNEMIDTGQVQIRRRVLGLPFVIAGNGGDASARLTLTGVNGEDIDASLAGDGQ